MLRLISEAVLSSARFLCRDADLSSRTPVCKEVKQKCVCSFVCIDWIIMSLRI